MDLESEHKMRDAQMIQLLELLFDHYHFKEEPTPEAGFMTDAYNLLIHKITKHLSKISKEELVKIIGAIYFTARRRTQGGREHLNFLAQYPIRLLD